MGFCGLQTAGAQLNCFRSLLNIKSDFFNNKYSFISGHPNFWAPQPLYITLGTPTSGHPNFCTSNTLLRHENCGSVTPSRLTLKFHVNALIDWYDQVLAFEFVKKLKLKTGKELLEQVGPSAASVHERRGEPTLNLCRGSAQTLDSCQRVAACALMS